jgi:hypothetical protein
LADAELIELLFCGSIDGTSSRRVYVILFVPPDSALPPSESDPEPDPLSPPPDPGVLQPVTIAAVIAIAKNAANNLFFIKNPPFYYISSM